MTAQERHHRLVEALVGEHERLYRTSPSFQHKIDSLARMLPEMIEGMVVESERQDSHRRAMVKAMSKTMAEGGFVSVAAMLREGGIQQYQHHQCSDGVYTSASPPQRCALPEGHEGEHEA